MSPWMIKRDGSVVFGIRNPDGSWWEIPARYDLPPAMNAPPPGTASSASQSSPTGNVREFLREIGKRGGQERARRHSRDELAAFGRVRHKSEPPI